MHTEQAGSDAAEEVSDGDRVVELLGAEIVVEEDFVTFPWRAGIARAPIAFLVAYAVVSLFASVAALGDGRTPLSALAVLGGAGLLTYAVVALLRAENPSRAEVVGYAGVLGLAVLVLGFARYSTGDVDFADQLAIVGIVTYNGHNIHAAAGLVPSALTPVADPVLGIPVVGRLLQGLFAVGQNHAAPVSHILAVFDGEMGTIGHLNLIEQQETVVPSAFYYLAPAAVLVGTGYEFARSEWVNAATDSPLEVTRFGIALGLGYVAVLLLGTIVFTYQGQSPLSNQLFTVLPDRYMTLIFGFSMPAILGSVGAAIVYLQRE